MFEVEINLENPNINFSAPFGSFIHSFIFKRNSALSLLFPHLRIPFRSVDEPVS